MKFDPNEITSEKIIESALSKENSIAVKTLEMFTKIYGAEAGNFGTRTLCYGGIYLCGGLTEKIKEYLCNSKEFFVFLSEIFRIISITRRV